MFPLPQWYHFRRLQEEGFTIGPGGWTLRVWLEIRNTDQNLMFKGGIGAVNIPQVATQYRLVSPAGEEAFRHGDVAGLGTGSKYFQGVKVIDRKPFEVTEEYTWNFKDKSPREAMIEEMLEQARGQGIGALRLPDRYGKFQGKYQYLPVQASAVFPPAARPRLR